MDLKLPATETNEEIQKTVLEKINNKKEIINPNNTQYSNDIDNIWNINNRIVKLYEDNIEKDREMRQIYAKILFGILIADLIALIIIFILVGCDVLNYSDFAFNLFITGGIAEVFVLVKIIIEYLFKDNLTGALNIILTNNNKFKNNYNKKNNKNPDKP